MKRKTRWWEVRNTFEVFGDRPPITYAGRAAAERWAQHFAEMLARSHYGQHGALAVIPPYSSAGMTGNAREIAWQIRLAADAGADAETGATGHVPWTVLVQRIRESAVQVREVKAQA